MHRTTADGNVSNLFAEADPVTGAPGTQIDATWMNDVQENLCQAIEAMGITLSPGAYTQLRDAILALLARVNTWTAQQTINALLVLLGGLNLSASGGQTIGKSGGSLTVGTSDANDVNLNRAGATMLALTSSGIDANNSALVNAARLVLQQLASDPSTPPPDGGIWYRSDTKKLRLEYNGTRDNLATEVWSTNAFATQTQVTPSLYSAEYSNHSYLVAYKVGRLVFVSGVVNCVTGGTNRGFIVVPTGYRPCGEVYATGVWVDNLGNTGPIMHTNSGVIAFAGNTTTVAGRFYEFSLTYLSDS